ncbi:MAG TPA: hypothetical protein VK915_04840 [Gaiellaceae bacterium]|nr:hypothetical protein [Gaiellaceae bacterium]
MRPAPPSPARALRARWTVATTAGEAAGFAVPAAGDPALVPAVVAAGAAEGAILGLGQSLVLCRKVAALRRRGWVVATAVAALFGWALAMPLGAFGGSLPAALLVLASTVVGAVLLAAVGRRSGSSSAATSPGPGAGPRRTRWRGSRA